MCSLALQGCQGIPENGGRIRQVLKATGGQGAPGSLGQILEDLCGEEGRGPGPLGRPMELVEATGGAPFSNWDIWGGYKAIREHLVLFEYWFVKSLAIQLVM